MQRNHQSRRLLAGPLLFLILVLGQGCARSMEIAGRVLTVTAADGFALQAYEMRQVGREGKPPRALLFYVQGSEPDTVTNAVERLAGAAMLDIPIYMVERRGVTHEGVADERAFHEFSTKPVRVSDQRAVLDHVLRDAPLGLPVILFGTSEGGDVAAAVAAQDARVTHLILLGSGGGWTQAMEFEHFIRTQGEYLGATSLDDLRWRFADIRAHPDAMTMWAGHPYRRWSSYLWDAPLDDLLALDIPVFAAHGDADDSVPVESARALVRAFESRGKTNLTYREYEGADHAFRHVKRDMSMHPFLELDVLRWLHEHQLITVEELATFEQRVRRNHPEWFAGAK
jgi:fermentation-respiration switch protein FrsA (DUF1100 family)